MAVYCPIYDPAFGWYIIVCGPNGSYRKAIISPLYYYHSMGIKPPVGAKFTSEDYMNFDLDLGDSELLGAWSALPPLPSLPSISSLTAPISTNSSQATAASKSEYDNLSDLKDPLLISTFGTSSVYSPFLNSATASAASTASSPQFLSTESSMLKNVVSLSKKLDAMESLLSSSIYGGQSGSLSLPTSPFTSSLAYPSATNSAAFKSNSPMKYPSKLSYLLPLPSTSSTLSHHLHSLPSTSSGYVNNSTLKHPSTLSYLLPLPSTSSSLSHHLHSQPLTSSGYVSVPPINPQCPVHGAATTNSSKVNNYPMSADYDDNMAYDMFLHDVDETPMEEDDYDF